MIIFHFFILFPIAFDEMIGLDMDSCSRNAEKVFLLQLGELGVAQNFFSLVTNNENRYHTTFDHAPKTEASAERLFPG